MKWYRVAPISIQVRNDAEPKSTGIQHCWSGIAEAVVLWDATCVPSSPWASVKSIALPGVPRMPGWLLLSFMGVGRLGRCGRRLLLLGGQVLFDPVFLLLKMVQAAPKG